MLARARTGDGHAFASLLRRHDEEMRRLAFGLLGDSARMEDVLQEAYMKAYTALAGFRGDAAFSTWLHRIVRNTCLDELRRMGRDRALRDELAGAADAAPDHDPSDAVDRASAVHAALTALPAEDRAAVWLVDAEGFDYRSAAEALEVPEGTVASRLNRARASLRLALSGESAERGDLEQSEEASR